MLLSNISSGVIAISQTYKANSIEEIEKMRIESKKQHAEGIMLKLDSSFYEAGRKTKTWFKYKIDPITIDAVLIYAQKGHGRRADLFTDYTFALWEQDRLVPFAKAYSGLTDKELVEIDRWIKKNTIEKFGPVRTVTPTLVFELAFEGISPSTRHKSGLAVRFPRILRWRKDKSPQEADKLDTLKKLLSFN
jgi:DNA ligase-1